MPLVKEHFPVCIIIYFAVCISASNAAFKEIYCEKKLRIMNMLNLHVKCSILRLIAQEKYVFFVKKMYIIFLFFRKQHIYKGIPI